MVDPLCSLYLWLSLFPFTPQVAQTPRFQSLRRNATPFHDAAPTRPPTPPVPRRRPSMAHIQPTQTTQARGENHPGLHTDRELCSGDRGRPGRANLVRVLGLKAVSRQHLLRTTSGQSGATGLLQRVTIFRIFLVVTCFHHYFT